MVNNEPMTAERRAAIKARADAATPGPWVVSSEYASGVDLGYKPDHERTWGYGCGNDFVCDLNDGEYHEYHNKAEQMANASFIAHARENVPALMAEVERLRAENKRLEKAANWLANMLASYEGCPHETWLEAFNRDAIPRIHRCKEWDAEDEILECSGDGRLCWVESAVKVTSEDGNHE